MKKTLTCSIRLSLIMLTMLSLISCQSSRMNKMALEKIRFDYSLINEDGLRNGEVAVDYEYCIPADESLLLDVQQIDPSVRVMKTSKGRIGCREHQWLCISNTHTPDWRKKLINIAKLEFVEQIAETVWE